MKDAFWMLLILIGFSIEAMYGQQMKPGIRPGELLIELMPGSTLGEVLNSNNRRAAWSTQVISARRQIHLLQLNGDIDLLDMRRQLERNPHIAHVQFNHSLLRRGGITTPNDPLFKDQWYLDRIGATTIWDQTTGGLTPCGDSIVIAVFDFGIDPDHEDMQGQIWLNSGEIPNNSFDDDQNGFVDDYLGLNLDTGDDQHAIDPEYHGTRVASVIGAASNNEQGLAGLNWNIKMMIVSSEEKDEATALQAFEYIRDQRNRYNESNGTEGAYVVAVNNSWGREGFFEEDFPILCGMFNDLGEVGILSVGSTENDQVNTDVFGDIPSDCSSEFLVVVTNTNELDELSVGGFGKENVDLGAPGESIRVVDKNNGYAFDSGTSFAAPLVAGSIGLLYSLPQTTFCDNARLSPPDASRDLKRYILEGVTPIDDLIDRTVSGGRLNLSRAADMATNVVERESPLLLVFPNPTSDQFYLQFLPNQGNVQVLIFDALGRRLFEAFEQTDVNRLLLVDARHWPSGHYFVQASNANQVYTSKLLKI